MQKKKVDLGYEIRTPWGVIAVCFGLTALLSELWSHNFSKKKSKNVCVFMSLSEQVAWLQYISVNEQPAHDITSALTCAVLHACLLWKT